MIFDAESTELYLKIACSLRDSLLVEIIKLNFCTFTTHDQSMS